jgi:hypothetical protein
MKTCYHIKVKENYVSGSFMFNALKWYNKILIVRQKYGTLPSFFFAYPMGVLR